MKFIFCNTAIIKTLVKEICFVCQPYFYDVFLFISRACNVCVRARGHAHVWVDCVVHSHHFYHRFNEHSFLKNGYRGI